ncbi:MAG TPA: DUF5689 domain-containing protein [Lacibacter sp.]|nr:DUF5689 domain-containing protein [Lacibacter sp.]HMO89464.1 DUF5689 domain-containing protein [Lacibacter sp.]
MKISPLARISVAALAAVVFLFSNQGCKRKFDEPPIYVAPDIQANTSIRQVKAQFYTSGQIKPIDQDLVIRGIVVADDKSGNFYKTLTIQDTSGAIAIRMDGNSLYTVYPIGREVFVKLQGLYIGDFARLVQIGGGIDNSDPTRPEVAPIASALFDRYLVRGSFNNAVAPRVVTIAELNDDMQNMFVQINDVEFQTADTAQPWANVVTRQSVNRTLRTCTGQTLIVRSSGYSNFADKRTPTGKGFIRGIYTVFNTTKQFVIRDVDTSNIQMTGLRCGQGPTTVINIADLRALYGGAATITPEGRRITGVVISDRSTSNLNNQNIVIQQGTGLAGIVVRFAAAHTFNLGDSLDVNISSLELSEFNGLMQVNNVPVSNAAVRSTGKSITPRTATITQINSNFEAWESTLVRIQNANLTGGTGGTYSGSVTVNDGATIVMFTTTSATFASQTYPANAASLTGYLGQFGTTRQIAIRNPGAPLNDVVAGTGGGGGGGGAGLALTTSPYTQNFNNIGSGLPQGFFAKIGASATVAFTGDMTQFNSFAATPWAQTSAGVKNFASATGLTSASTDAEQAAASNRAMGIRQTTTVGYDPGSAFVMLLDNTTGKSNFQLSFLLQSLDATVGRTTTWTVDYGVGDSPATFTAITTTPAVLTTGGLFSSTPVSVTLPAALNNQSQKVWIRIVALTAAPGSGNRPSSAIDDVQLTWN